MAQLNINLDSEFQRDLLILLKATGEKHKSTLIKKIIRKAVEQLGLSQKRYDFNSLLGVGNTKDLRSPKLTEDDLWS